ncbi:MAG: TetR/AcrR family transcriptional repressor of nem operon [Alphaproteobacteria bacterium]|jgi:TetR/AcrR family transcriptional repressor of nem operon
MARAREFSADIALIKAIEMFWEFGYANTSMRQLVIHTGVAHAGLYTAFGGKDELFKAALEKYEELIFSYLFSGLESNRASIKDIKKLFTFITSASDDKYFKHGCFIANTALEFGGKTGPIHKILNRTFTRQVKAFEHALKNAVSNGQISKSTKVADTASSFTVLFYGCSSLTRMKAPSDNIQKAIAAALDAIEVH